MYACVLKDIDPAISIVIDTSFTNLMIVSACYRRGFIASPETLGARVAVRSSPSLRYHSA